MILAADIGNTNITLGLYDAQRLTAAFRLETQPSGLCDGYGEGLMRFLWENNVPAEAIEGVIIASVVPKAAASLAHAAEKLLNRKPLHANRTMKLGITVKTDAPEQVGVDRLVNTAAAYRFYGGPALVIDFGTATTYDVVTAGGEFLGGVIAPGVGICAEALWAKTAMLPKISIQKPDRVLGTNTVNCMQSGVFYGYLGQVEYLAGRLKKELNLNFRVIATGGLSNLFRGCTDAVDVFDAHLR